MNEKLVKMCAIVGGGFVVLILFLFLISSCSKKTMTYLDYENEMVNAAKSYYKRNEKKLPNEDGEVKKLNLKNLKSDGFIEEEVKFFDDKTMTCNGTVSVKNNNGYYRYIPNLTCKNEKDKYATKTLYKEIEKTVTTEGEGLFEVKGDYIFKGNKVNNYLVLNGEEYRIIRLNADGTIRLIKVNGLDQKVWDKIWNPDYKYMSGFNEYTHDTLNSEIKDTIEKYYDDGKIWSDDTKSYIETQTLCIGKRSREDVTKDGSTECAVKIEAQFGLLAAYEYLSASSYKECSSTLDNGCKNYNWMTNIKQNKSLWFVTAASEDTKTAYSLSYGLTTKTCAGYGSINVVFNISGDVPFQKGDGSFENPYVVGKDIVKKK